MPDAVSSHTAAAPAAAMATHFSVAQIGETLSVTPGKAVCISATP
jgi:hypothetical protein